MYAIIKSLVCFDVLYVVVFEVTEDSVAAYRTETECMDTC